MLAVVCALAFASPAWSQVPGVANGFGVDGNLLANSPGGIFLDTNDWLDGPGGTGTGVLNWNGTPKDPTMTFHVLDLTGNADLDVFAESDKVFHDPNTYDWKGGSVPQKDDIQNGLLHIFTDAEGDLWIAMAGDRRAINGDSYIDFEFLQAELYKNADGTFTSLGPDGGRTVGDILLTIELTRGGTQALFFAQQWGPDGAGGFTYFDFVPPANSSFVSANVDSMVAVPYGAFGLDLYGINQFGEAGANLTDLISSMGECYGIATVFIRTKSSASATAQLKDLIEPIQLNYCLDEVDPTLSGCPSELVNVQCMDDVPAPANVTAWDYCDADVDIVFNEVDDGQTCPKTITRTWTATDDCDNTASCSQTIIIDDTTDPVLSGCPVDVTVQCIGNVPAPANVTATDNCDGSIKPVLVEVDDGKTCPKVITRTWTATDACGNDVSCSQKITVDDTTNPVLTGCPNDVTVQCMGDVPAPANVTATDNCDGSIKPVLVEVDDGKTCPKVITRTWTAT
ncbi:MAG: hypothetical protein HY770_00460, partial [Chitinivibrionia bacterium]|nr:hypothetical protein [Chitinivibrionia bacterium]